MKIEKIYRDDFKIKFRLEPTYVIDSVKGTVECYLCGDIITPTGLYYRIMENTRMYAKGYSKCSKKDTFDPEVGKKVALARAESRLYVKARSEIRRAKRDAEMFIKGADKFVKKAKRVVEHDQIYIDTFTYPDGKKTTSQILSEKAKSQTRDEKGRFTACTKNEKTSCCDKNKEIVKGEINDNKKVSNCAPKGVIRIEIKRV